MFICENRDGHNSGLLTAKWGDASSMCEPEKGHVKNTNKSIFPAHIGS